MKEKYYYAACNNSLNKKFVDHQILNFLNETLLEKVGHPRSKRRVSSKF